MRESALQVALAVVLGCVTVVSAFVLGFRGWLDAPLNLYAPVTVELPPGGNVRGLLSELRARDVLMHPFLLRAYLRIDNKANKVRAGEYRLEPGITARGVIEKLLTGDVVEYVVTVVEGTTIAAMLRELHGQPKLQCTVSGAGGEHLKSVLQPEFSGKPSPEGLFFPDTYLFHLGMSDRDLLALSHRRLVQVLEEEWDARAEGLPYKNAYEALVMASLVERETGKASERGAIAGVFVRRLQRGMLLQTDPAVIYGLGDGFDGNLTRAHLRAPNPYNTYLNPGLPPTPIALPGRAAIHAALHPEAGEALYFVARGDGSHHFSATLAEHNRAVNKYQRSGRRTPESGRKGP